MLSHLFLTVNCARQERSDSWKSVLTKRYIKCAKQCTFWSTRKFGSLRLLNGVTDWAPTVKPASAVAEAHPLGFLLYTFRRKTVIQTFSMGNITVRPNLKRELKSRSILPVGYFVASCHFLKNTNELIQSWSCGLFSKTRLGDDMIRDKGADLVVNVYKSSTSTSRQQNIVSKST